MNMRHTVRAGLVVFLTLSAGLVAMGWFYRSVDQAGVARAPTVEIQPSSTIVGLQVPFSSGQNGNKAMLKAAYATQINENEIRVYGGFEYLTPTKRIVGEEAIIELSTGRVRNVRNVKIWER
jgi:hypothetical protein